MYLQLNNYLSLYIKEIIHYLLLLFLIVILFSMKIISF